MTAFGKYGEGLNQLQTEVFSAARPIPDANSHEKSEDVISLLDYFYA
jgi:glycerate-2-kinase